MLRAADLAVYFEKRTVTVLEFGVASGAGIMNMIKLADLIHAETGVTFEIVGFDTGAGLPSVQGYKDHPEVWNPGDFRTEQKSLLERKLEGKARIIWGDVGETGQTFLDSLDERAPIGFASVDVDLYSSTIFLLHCFEGDTSKYLPAISLYFDDTSFFFANRWCGELAAIEEFNDRNAMRKIDQDRSLPGHRPSKFEAWYKAMYVCHVLDHPARQSPRARGELAIGEHAKFMKDRFLF
jgi:hypothetical protein